MSANKHWTVEENALLRQLYQTLVKNWEDYTKYFPYRTPESIRVHWHRLINPKQKKQKVEKKEESLSDWEFLF
jgi:hypothetical protein